MKRLRDGSPAIHEKCMITIGAGFGEKSDENCYNSGLVIQITQ